MTYATQQNMIDRFGQQELTELTDRARSGAIDSSVTAKALADADAEINGYLVARYTLPFASVPTVLERLACNMARYYLYEDRVTDQVRQRYDDAIKFLKGVAAGTVSLGVDAANAAPAQSSGPDFSAPDRVFTTDTLSDYA
jgi:phage gp36-like protein